MGFDDLKPIIQSIPHDNDGNPLHIEDGYALTPDSRGMMAMIQNPSGEAKFLTADADGYLQVISPAASTIVGQVELIDGYGDPITVIEDGYDRRLAVEATFPEGTVISTTSSNIITVDAISEFLRNAGSEDMVVDGSGTPVSFVYVADLTNDTLLSSLRLVFSAAFFKFDGDSFGKGGGPLAAGVNINIVANNGTINKTLMTLTVDEDFLRLLEFSVSQAGATDTMAASVIFGGRILLEAGSGDQVEVVVNDDLTSGSRGIAYFTATLYGTKE